VAKRYSRFPVERAWENGRMTTRTDDVRRSSGRARVVVVRDGAAQSRVDNLATEEPMEIRAAGPGQDPFAVAVTMRTPGNDFDLAVGFLFTEGLLGPDDVDRISYCDTLEGDQDYNVVTVRTRARFEAPGATRRFYATSSCGICGKASLDEVEVRCAPLPPGPVVARSVITTLPGALEGRQPVFAATGGLHAAGLFDASGGLAAAREDVGRHNAVDKLVGARVLSGDVPLSGSMLLVSGRVSFEILQKAAVAGIPIVCAVSAPSTLAVAAAERLGVTVVGFLRGETFNVYSHPERIDLEG
jgi:FdhD protein